MSGVVKSVKKVFKKVVKVLKKIIVPVLIAAAVYFTAGLALAAFAPTAGFAASMPLFAGGGIAGLGIGGAAVAGTGIFTQAAVFLGVGGGLTAGAISAGTTVAELAAVHGASTAIGAMGGAGMLTSTQAAAAQSTIAGHAAATAAGTGAAGAVTNVAAMAGTPPASGMLPKAAQSIGKMSFSDKLLMTKIGTDTVGALFGPTPQEVAEAEAIEAAKFRGAFYGVEADGSGGAGGAGVLMPEGATTSQPSVFNTSQANQTQKAGYNQVQKAGYNQVQSVAPPQNALQPSSITPEQRNLLEGRQKKELFPGGQKQQVGMTTGPGPSQSVIPIPGNISSPSEGVRYV